jgi:hypothetical protein
LELAAAACDDVIKTLTKSWSSQGYNAVCKHCKHCKPKPPVVLPYTHEQTEVREDYGRFEECKGG